MYKEWELIGWKNVYRKLMNYIVAGAVVLNCCVKRKKLKLNVEGKGMANNWTILCNKTHTIVCMHFIIKSVHTRTNWIQWYMVFDKYLIFVWYVMVRSLPILIDQDYTQLSGPGIEFAMMISFIKFRSALKLIGSHDLVENGFSWNTQSSSRFTNKFSS